MVFNIILFTVNVQHFEYNLYDEAYPLIKSAQLFHQTHRQSQKSRLQKSQIKNLNL
jgi:hypothetical protein